MVAKSLCVDLDVRPLVVPGTHAEAVRVPWQERLPVLDGTHVRLRELQPSDAISLVAMLTTEEMTRFISPPPTSREGFERFIAWTIRERACGAFVGYAAMVRGLETPVGLFQVRRLDATFELAEWGFAIGSPFWGTGVFEEGATLVLDFVFNTLNVHRLEARAAVRNGRGHGALLKMGAVPEGILRKSLLHEGRHVDQVMYSMLNEDWQARDATTHATARRLLH